MVSIKRYPKIESEPKRSLVEDVLLLTFNISIHTKPENMHGPWRAEWLPWPCPT